MSTINHSDSMYMDNATLKNIPQYIGQYVAQCLTWSEIWVVIMSFQYQVVVISRPSDRKPHSIRKL